MIRRFLSPFLSPFLAPLLAVAALPPGLAAADLPRLTVYTYDAFAADWGPAPAIETAFEAQCGCDLRFVAVDVSGSLLTRLQLEGAASDADVILGLDTALMLPARATGLLADHQVPGAAITALPGGWSAPDLLPFDYGHFAFVYDSRQIDPARVPHSFTELAASDLKIVIEDPRTSTPGLGLLLWVRKVMGDQAGATWQALADNIVTVTKDWSEAYGLFLKGEADMVLSYTTSPAYHRLAEGDDHYRWARFDVGHYAQIELAAALASSTQLPLARQFMAFIASEGFQSAIPTGNWMYPVTDLALPEGFDPPLPAELTLLFSPEEVEAQRSAWIAEWLDAVTR